MEDDDADDTQLVTRMKGVPLYVYGTTPEYREVLRGQHWGNQTANSQLCGHIYAAAFLLTNREWFYREYNIVESLPEPLPNTIEVYMSMFQEYMRTPEDRVLARLDEVELYLDSSDRYVFVSSPTDYTNNGYVQEEEKYTPGNYYSGDMEHRRLGWVKLQKPLYNLKRTTYVKVFEHKKTIAQYWNHVGLQKFNRQSLAPCLLNFFLSL
jgi:hypothetical protein